MNLYAYARRRSGKKSIYEELDSKEGVLLKKRHAGRAAGTMVQTGNSVRSRHTTNVQHGFDRCCLVMP